MFVLQDCTNENLISLTRHISNRTCSYNEELCSCMSGRIEIVFFCQDSSPLYDKSKEIYSYLHDRSNAMSPFFLTVLSSCSLNFMTDLTRCVYSYIIVIVFGKFCIISRNTTLSILNCTKHI